LHNRTSDEDAAFERVFRLVYEPPRDGSEQIVFRHNGFAAGVHKHKTVCAVSVFDHAGPGADLAEQRSLLVARNAGDGFSWLWAC
jgi:hypothetical protein